MIIACESCSTRFNVPDDKVKEGGTKVRCSKCSHVFLAKPPSGFPSPTATQALGTPAPAPAAAPDPFAPAPPATQAMGSQPADPFAAPSPSGATPAADPFGAPSPKSGPSADPFGAPSPKSGPSADPFGAPAAPETQALGTPGGAADPFAPPGGSTPPSPAGAADPFAPPGGSTPPSPAGAADPFAPPENTATQALGTPGPAADPFAPPGGSTPPSPAGAADPFAPPGGSTPPSPAGAADPFAPPGGSTPPSPAGAADPFAPPGGSTPPSPAGAADPFAPPGGDADPFGPPGASPGGADPFAPPGAAAPAAAVAPGSDPFGVGGDMPTGSGRDLLGTYGDADQDVDNAGFDATPSAIFGPSDMGGGGPPPAPPDDDDENPNDFGVPGGDAFDPDAQSTEDLFAGMGLESPGAHADDAFGPPAAAGNIQAETRVYEAPQHLVEQSKAPPAEAAPAASSPSSPTKSGGGFKMPRAVAMLWSVLWQVTVLGVFLVAAVVWARGGNVDDVKEGRLVRVVLYGGGSSQHGALEVHDVNVERMPVSADENLVVVTGRVTNTSEESLPVVVITAKLHDRTYAAQVGATFDVKRLHDAESVAALQRVAPAGGGPLGPHETGDFELLMLGAKDGDEAVLSVAQTAALLDLAPPPIDVEPEATKDAKTNGATDDKAGKKGAKAGKSKRKKGKKKARKRRKKASSDDDDDAS